LGGPISLLDVVILKKYPIYFTEYQDSKPQLRCLQTAETFKESSNLSPNFKLLVADTLSDARALLTLKGK
jgi:hypothetical protein